MSALKNTASQQQQQRRRRRTVEVPYTSRRLSIHEIADKLHWSDSLRHEAKLFMLRSEEIAKAKRDNKPVRKLLRCIKKNVLLLVKKL